MAKQKILPLFIPMEGCPRRCIYCDQHAISGQAAPVTAAEVAQAAESLPVDSGVQLAFYGGSFTALTEARQTELLQAVQPALAQRRITSLRLSTRPDAVDAATLARLRGYGVAAVELGVQSFDDAVLRASGRGYDAEAALAACRQVADAGLTLGVQLMCGLPGDSREACLRSAYLARELGAALLRIYPTLVLRGTPLARLWQQGRYQPQELAEAVEVAAEMTLLFEAGGGSMIRAGLNPSPATEAACLAGPYHPAFGHMVRSRIKLQQALAVLAQVSEPRELHYPRTDAPQLFGQAGANAAELRQRYPQLQLVCAEVAPGALIAVGGGGRAENTLDAASRALAAKLLANLPV
ncbi:MAG: radical SAM protein [Firmicutes bacterium]|nr:radical SAM protein [Bacillota bacterium]